MCLFKYPSKVQTLNASYTIVIASERSKQRVAYNALPLEQLEVKCLRSMALKLEKKV